MDRAVRKGRGHVRTVFHHRHARSHRGAAAGGKHNSAVENVSPAVGGDLCIGKAATGFGILVNACTGHFCPGNAAQTGYRRRAFHGCGLGGANRAGNRIQIRYILCAYGNGSATCIRSNICIFDCSAIDLLIFQLMVFVRTVIPQFIIGDAASHGSRPGPGHAACYRKLPAVVHRCNTDSTGVADCRNRSLIFIADPDSRFQVVFPEIQGNGTVEGEGGTGSYSKGHRVDFPIIGCGYAYVGVAVLCRRHIGAEQIGNCIVIQGIIRHGKPAAVFARGYLTGQIHIPVTRSGFDVQYRRQHGALFHHSGNRIFRFLDADRTGPVKLPSGSGHAAGDIHQKGIGISGYIQTVQVVFTVCYPTRRNRCIGYISPEVIADQSHRCGRVGPGRLSACRNGKGHCTDISAPVGRVNGIDGIPVRLRRSLPVFVRGYCIIYRHAALCCIGTAFIRYIGTNLLQIGTHGRIQIRVRNVLVKGFIQVIGVVGRHIHGPGPNHNMGTLVPIYGSLRRIIQMVQGQGRVKVKPAAAHGSACGNCCRHGSQVRGGMVLERADVIVSAAFGFSR